jgi:ABC-type phosphate transport system auxiliary subunit
MADQKKLFSDGKLTSEQEDAFIKEQAKEGNEILQLEENLKKLKAKKNKPSVPPKSQKSGGGYMKKMKKGGKVSSGYKCSHNRLY